MKKLFIIPLLCLVAFAMAGEFIPNTNTVLTPEVVKQEVGDVTAILGQWKNVIGVINTSGMTINNVIALLIVILLSVTVLGVITVLLLNLIKFFTSDRIDEKIDKIEDVITKYCIKLPVYLTAKIRGIIRKKP